MTKTEEVLALARRLVALEAEASVVRRKLDELVEGTHAASTPAARTRQPSPSRRSAAADGGDVQAVVLRLVLADPDRAFRAGELRSMLPGRPGKNSVESALQRLMTAGQLERAGRGLYQAPRGRRAP